MLGVGAAARAAAAAVLSCCAQLPQCEFSRGCGISMSQLARPDSASRAEDESLPTLPSGRRLELLSKSMTSTGVGGRVWNAAPMLCRWMLAAADEIDGAVVVECEASWI